MKRSHESEDREMAVEDSTMTSNGLASGESSSVSATTSSIMESATVTPATEADVLDNDNNLATDNMGQNISKQDLEEALEPDEAISAQPKEPEQGNEQAELREPNQPTSPPLPNPPNGASPPDQPKPSEQSGTSNEPWKGWAELENDPTIFSVMLREWGVKGIQVREIIPLDAIFDVSPTSIYGLIFLSRYTVPEPAAELPTIPQELWFANQVSSYSCATVALMNIINNRADLNLGIDLNAFRLHTTPMSSKDKGIALDGFDHVRNVHNSFATEIDRMSVDIRLKQDATRAAKAKRPAQKKKKKGKGKGRGKKQVADEEDDETGFHFIAYVPRAGQVWKLDGLELRPQALGVLEDDANWLNMVVPDLQGQWESAAASEFEFSLLSLVKADGDEEAVEEEQKAGRMREDWGPLMAYLVKLHAEKGTLEEMLKPK